MGVLLGCVRVCVGGGEWGGGSVGEERVDISYQQGKCAFFVKVMLFSALEKYSLG